MSRFVKTGYAVCSAILVLMFVFMMATFRLDIWQRDTFCDYDILENCSIETVRDDNAELGQLIRCTFVPEDWGLYEHTLVFSAYHQNVEVKIDGEVVYSMRADEGNAFGRTPGCVWNYVTIREEDLGRTVEVDLEPVYKNSLDIVPDLYIGSKYDICRDMILKDLPAMVLGIFAVLIGLTFVIYIMCNIKNTEVDRNLLMLGLFSIQVGLWKISDLDGTHILFPRSVVLSYLPYFTLMFIVIPFTFFIRSLHSTSKKPSWDIPCLFCLGGGVIQLALQLFRIADLREMLWLTHTSLFLLCAVDVVLIVREVKTRGWNRRLKRNVGCIGICFLGMILDMGVYYVSRGTTQTVLGMLGFTTYNVVLGIYSIKDAKALMAIGMQAKLLENKAYHDQLTGLSNRTAFAEFITAEGFLQEKCIVVMFDLNNLKQCNDTLGHEFGDRYICEGAGIIKNCFSDLGPCYRMGGDEFCALLSGCSVRECKKRIERVEQMSEEYNKTHEDIRIGIACGYEVFDKRIDYDINDTLRRADKMMYEKKFSMKH